MDKIKIQQIVQKAQKPLTLMGVIIIMTILRPGMFLTGSNIMSILLAVSIYGLIVCGSIYPILNGGIDLSVGSVAALSGSIAVLITIHFNYSVQGTIIGILCALVAGIAAGFFNGFISCMFGIPSFIVTLASQNIILGIAQFLTHNNTISCLDSDLINWIGTGKVAYIPFTIIMFLIVIGITYVVLNRTPFGRYTYAVGGNPLGSKFSGIKVKLVSITSFVISGLGAALAGVMLSCFNRQAVATQGGSYMGDVLVALVVGGISITGGEGSIQGGMFGILLMGILSNAMVLLGVESIYQSLIKGLIIVTAVSIDMYAKHKNNGMAKKSKGFNAFASLKALSTSK